MIAASPNPAARWASCGTRLCALAIVTLTGCASPVATPSDPGAAPAFDWSGRFSASWSVSNGADLQNASGRFFVRQQDDAVRMEVYSPFGQTLARARADPQGATLETSNGESYRADSPELLTEQVMGWRIPVSSLPKWFRELDKTERKTTELIESGWAVTFATANTGSAKMTLRWPAESVSATDRTVTIHLVLDSPQ
ncbi:MAG: outer membrane lipoprotein LolB [Quisquiliibacterium sp.]